MAKLVLGCGYLGSRVAERWREAGQSVTAVTRSPLRAEQLGRSGIVPLVADVTRPESLAALPLADTVLYAVGYDRAAGLPMRKVYVDGLRAVLDALPSEIGRIIYISSTGVYGQTQGEWIDEGSPCEPRREGGRVCLEAERALAAHRLGARAVVLRMAGLYGPGRVPRREALNTGMPIAADAAGWINLIHVDDAASAVLAAERLVKPPRTLLVSDGCPLTRGEYFAELARLLGCPPPHLVPDADGSARAERGESSKRVRPARSLATLQLTLRYPTYREGLAAAVAVDQTSGAG